MTGPKISSWICSSSWLQAGEHGRLVEVARLALPLAAGLEAGVVGQPVDHAGDPVELVGVVERAVEHVLVVGHAGLGALGLLGQRGDEVVVHARPGEHAGGGGAVLAGVEVAGLGDRRSAAFSMSASSKTITGALPPSSRWTRLRSAAADAGDLHAGPDRAGDRDHLRGLVLDQRAAGVAVAADDVEHARRQELLRQLGRAASTRPAWCRDGLSTTVLPAASAGRDLPDHHHQRVVPGVTWPTTPIGSRRIERGVVGHVLAGRPALEHPGGAGEEPEVVDASAAAPRSRSGRAACRCPSTRP